MGTLAGGLDCCPLDDGAYPPPSECWGNGSRGIRSLIGFGILVWTLSHPVLYLHGLLTQRSPSSDFGENQLSRGLISLSLLPTAHPRHSQVPPVRTFTRFYPGFILAMGRSPPLRVYCPRLAAHFVLAFASRTLAVTLATDNNSQTHYAKGRPSHLAVLRHIVSKWLQDLFHSPRRGSFRLSLAVLVHYRLPVSI